MPSKEVVEQARKEEERRRRRESNEPNIREKLLAMRKTRRERPAKTGRRWEELIARIPVAVPTRGAEIGVWRGSTAVQVLKKRPLATHLMIDCWKAPEADSRYATTPGSTQKRPQEVFDAAYDEVVESVKGFKERAPIMRMYSEVAAKEVPNHSLDYVFIDAEHTYEGVRDDIRLWREKVKHGGWIGGHDYENLPNFPGVKKAVLEAFSEDDVQLGADHTWWVRLL